MTLGLNYNGIGDDMGKYLCYSIKKLKKINYFKFNLKYNDLEKVSGYIKE